MDASEQAGLFSAVLTAFNVQSYTLLTPDPQDRLLGTLQQISAQLGSFSVNPSPVGVNQAYEIIWDYVEGEAPDDFFGIEVQGEGGYLQWFGWYNSSGSTSAPGPPSIGYAFLIMLGRPRLI